MAYCFNKQSNIYKYFGQNETALRKNLLAFELLSNGDCFFELSRFATEIGEHQEAVKNYEGAKYYYQISLENAQKLNDNSQVGQGLSYLGNLLRLEGKYNESQKMNFRALATIYPLKDQIRVAETEKNIGLNYFDTKKYELANEHYINAISYYKAGGNNPRIAEMYFLLGKLFFVQQQENVALDYFLKSNKIAENFGTQHAKYKSYPFLAEIYEARGDNKASYKFMKEYMTFLNETEDIEAKIKKN